MCSRVARYLNEIGSSDWRLVGDRLFQPEAIVSVDIVEDRIAKWATDEPDVDMDAGWMHSQ